MPWHGMAWHEPHRRGDPAPLLLAGNFTRFDFTFSPSTCYTPRTKPCTLLKKSYAVLPAKKAGVFPPPELAPGEYLTAVRGLPRRGGATVLLASRLLAVGTK